MPKFIVYLMTPYASYEIDAKDEDDAISKCEVPSKYANEPFSFLATRDERED